MKHVLLGRLGLLVLLALSAGCATPGYRIGRADDYHVAPALATADAQIEHGRPNPVVDTVGWVFGIPSKVLMWNIRMENHRITPETEEAIGAYLARNELTTVKVRLNQYAPMDDWRRLRANDAVAPGWKYTLGTLSWLGETLIPGRVFGGDHYNPFTNTIHVYSDVPAVALHEGGHAKDFARRYYKGTYAAAYLLPVVPLWHEALATGDVLSYLRAEGTIPEEQAAYCVLYPAYGTYVGNALSGAIPAGGTPLYLAGVLGGHVAGRYQAWRIGREADRSPRPEQEVSSTRPKEKEPSKVPPASAIQPASHTEPDRSPDLRPRRSDDRRETSTTR